MQALYAGEENRARKLLRADAELSIFEAAAFGRIERLKELVAGDGSQVSAMSSDGFTPLHLAIFGKQEAAVRALIAGGADLNVLSQGPVARVPPLGTGVFVRAPALVRVLLEAGADVNARFGDGSVALHTAAINGDEDLIKLMLEYGGDRTVRNQQGNRPSDLARDERIRNLLA